MDNNEIKILQMFGERLNSKGIDSSFLQENEYDFNQKFVLYRAALRGLDATLMNPDMSASEMEDILDDQMTQLVKVRSALGLDTDKYNFDQIRELVDGINKGLDVTPYMSHEYSAKHMYVAKTIQLENLGGLEKLTPDMKLEEFLVIRAEERENNNKEIIARNSESQVNQLIKSFQQNSELKESIMQMMNNILDKSSKSLEESKMKLADTLILQNVDIEKFEEFNPMQPDNTENVYLQHE